MTKRRHKVKVLTKKRKSHAEVAKMARTKSVKLWRRKRKFVLVLLSHLKLQKLKQQQCRNAKFVYICMYRRNSRYRVWKNTWLQASNEDLEMHPPWLRGNDFELLFRCLAFG